MEQTEVICTAIDPSENTITETFFVKVQGKTLIFLHLIKNAEGDQKPSNIFDMANYYRVNVKLTVNNSINKNVKQTEQSL